MYCVNQVLGTDLHTTITLILPALKWPPRASPSKILADGPRARQYKPAQPPTSRRGRLGDESCHVTAAYSHSHFSERFSKIQEYHTQNWPLMSMRDLTHSLSVLETQRALWWRSAALEWLMTELASCMLWSTGSVAPGVYEHRRTTRLIHFRHRSFRSGRRRWYCRTLFKKDMGPKGGNKHPAKILPGDHKHKRGKRYPAHQKPQPGPDGPK